MGVRRAQVPEFWNLGAPAPRHVTPRRSVDGASRNLDVGLSGASEVDATVVTLPPYRPRYGGRVFGRRSPTSRPDEPGVGIGALVQVVNGDRGGERWAGDPVGVVVAPGGNQIGGLQRAWVVAFDEPVYTEDGRGPYERATVLTRQLVPLTPDA